MRSSVPPYPSPLRSLLALLVGFFLRDSLIRLGAATIVALVPAAFPHGVPEPRGWIMIVIWGGIAATFAGLATGIIVGRREVAHAAFLAMGLLAMGIAGIVLGHEPVNTTLALISVSTFGVLW